MSEKQESWSPQPNIGAAADLQKLSARFWAMTVLTGIGAGIAGGLLMKLLSAVQQVSWAYGPGDFEDAVARATWWRHIAILLGAGLIAGLGRRIIQYTTGGHGGELNATVWFKAGKFPAITTFSKAVLSIVIVGMGAAMGREGALKQSGAAIASKLSDWVGLPPPQRRLLAACGGGAGMAAAYNVPFGGAFFALEVLLGTVSLPLVVPALATSVIATAVSWIFLPTHATYSVPNYALAFQQVWWALLAGPVFGLASVWYIRLIGWADKKKPTGIWMILSPVLVFTMLGAIAIPLPEMLGNGKDLVQRVLVSDLPLGLLAMLMILRPLATAFCLGSGAPGGLFTPTMTMGALLGGFLGHIWGLFAGGATPGSFALIGAAAVLSATTKGPISSVILIMELTRRADATMVPLLLAVSIATVISRRMETRSIYSGRLEAGEAMAVDNASEYVAIPASATYGEVVRKLLEGMRRSVPLVVKDDEGKAVGEVTAEAAENAKRSAVPMDTATAGDLAQDTPVIEALVRSKLLDKR